MVKKIIAVETSAAGRKYCTDSKGNPMFARTPGLVEKLTEGHYANVVEQLQTKTRGEDGQLVDLPVEEQRKLWIVTAVFPTKQEAIETNAEEQLFDVETAAFIQATTASIAEKYKVAPKSLETAVA